MSKKKPNKSNPDQYPVYRDSIMEMTGMGMTQEQIAQALNLHRTTVANYVQRLKKELLAQSQENKEKQVNFVLSQKKSIIETLYREFLDARSDKYDKKTNKIIRKRSSRSELNKLGRNLVAQIESYEKTLQNLGIMDPEMQNIKHELSGQVDIKGIASHIAEIKKQEKNAEQ